MKVSVCFFKKRQKYPDKNKPCIHPLFSPVTTTMLQQHISGMLLWVILQDPGGTLPYDKWL